MLRSHAGWCTSTYASSGFASHIRAYVTMPASQSDTASASRVLPRRVLSAVRISRSPVCARDRAAVCRRNLFRKRGVFRPAVARVLQSPGGVGDTFLGSSVIKAPEPDCWLSLGTQKRASSNLPSLTLRRRAGTGGLGPPRKSVNLWDLLGASSTSRQLPHSVRF